MLEEYSKGKVLTIKTQRKKKIKKRKNKKKKAQFFGDVDEGEVDRIRKMHEEDMDEDYDPNRPDNLGEKANDLAEKHLFDDEVADIYDDSELEEDSDEE